MKFQLPPAVRSLLFPALALALCFAAWRSYGWQGLMLAALMISFWVLLHFTKLMRLLRAAAARPMGDVADVRRLQSRLSLGMPMHNVVRHAGCLGVRLPDGPDGSEHFAWEDPEGRALHLQFMGGRLTAITHQDATTPPEAPPAAP